MQQYIAETVVFFFFNDTATTEIYTLSLHDALPICIRQIIYKTADYGNDNVVASKNYQPYGSVIAAYNNATDYRYDFTGKQLDTETNLRYFACPPLLKD